LFDAIRGLLHLVFEAGLFRLERLLETFAVGVELPAVIRAANAVGLERAVVERRGAVRTMIAEQRPASASVAEEHQLFTQDFKFLFRFFGSDLGCGTERVPVAAEQISRRRSRPNARHRLVVLLAQHESASVT